ncbi:unnamed protein product [Schistocephalus solidus]|uniref:Secreted protein n=1 Tax=Schistocephalus solidus TaxID=70667 RepID=A0A183TMP9_SCHSO|nr:unnamed protein product [Schistocephalus solidus]
MLPVLLSYVHAAALLDKKLFSLYPSRPASLVIQMFNGQVLGDCFTGERRLFHLACSTKAVSRDVEVAFLLVPRGASLPSSSTSPRSPPGLATTSLSIIFPFVLVGGTRDFGVFISQVSNPSFPLFSGSLCEFFVEATLLERTLPSTLTDWRMCYWDFVPALRSPGHTTHERLVSMQSSHAL